MSEPIIQVENLSKLYRLGEIGYRTFRESLQRWWPGHRTTPVPPYPGIDPLQVGPEPNTFWALQDVSLSIQRGEVLGIIGRNGAGKSTLLKILSRITEPTSGHGVIRGRVGSLLEVGAGFHPELTGRDNIFLNGAILGMSKAEIWRQLDEILAFADVGGFIDTPVKRYSSGMFVRLAFAIAAHLDPDILIVDEVLAVGDVNFQRKCLGRMREISATQARTVLFVSHNLEAVQRLCSHCLLLDRGRVQCHGETPSVIAQYLGTNTQFAAAATWIDLANAVREGSGAARFVQLRFSSGNDRSSAQPYSNGPLEFDLAIDANEPLRVQSIAVGIRDDVGRKLVNADTGALGQIIPLLAGRSIVRLRIESLHLKPGIYTVALWLARYAGERISGGDVLDFIERAIQLEVVDLAGPGFRTSLGGTGVVTCDFSLLEVSHSHTLREGEPCSR
jgi:lipopolysaccharide transport system ATP-binding protein